MYAGSNTSHKVTELAPGQPYEFRVAACNAVGYGTWSSAATASTHLQPPQPPLSISAQLQTSPTDRHALSPPYWLSLCTWARMATGCNSAKMTLSGPTICYCLRRHHSSSTSVVMQLILVGVWCRPSIWIQWEPGSQASDVAECATQEVECSNCTEPRTSPKPLTCPGRATECTISGLAPGCQYQVDLLC